MSEEETAEIQLMALTIKFLEKEIEERDNLLERIQNQINMFSKEGVLPWSVK